MSPAGPALGLFERVVAAADAIGLSGRRVVVGFSGGRDSVVLLHLLGLLRQRTRFVLGAVHVHHGLSPNADAWASFCEAFCALRAIPLSVHHVTVSRADARGVEAAARAARYRCYRAAGADIVALAHHADDQAETVLLQLLRGAGASGLAAMPVLRPLGPHGFLWRPLLGVPRHRIEAEARAAGLRWIEDESNEDSRHPRNFIRNEILPRLGQVFPAWRETLARSARNAAEAARLADQLGEMDLREVTEDEGLVVARLLVLDGVRQSNALRCWLVRQGCSLPGREPLLEFLAQLREYGPDRQPALRIGKAVLACERGRLRLVVPAADTAPWSVAWHGEASLDLPDGRELLFAPAAGEGLRRTVLEDGPVVIGLRRGGERMKIADGRPTRTLKNLLRESGVPPSERGRLPLVFVGDRLAHVPGIALDPAFAAARGEPGVKISLSRTDRDGTAAQPEE